MTTTYYPKPLGRFYIHSEWGRHCVCNHHGTRLTAYFTRQSVAESELIRLQAEDDKKAKRGPRACLGCGKGFESEGIHNRMCQPCRLRASQEQDVPFSFGVVSGRKRA